MAASDKREIRRWSESIFSTYKHGAKIDMSADHLCNNKREVIDSLSLVREALALCTDAHIDVESDRLTLCVFVNMKQLLGMVEIAVLKQGLSP